MNVAAQTVELGDGRKLHSRARPWPLALRARYCTASNSCISCLTWIQATSTRGIRACLRRVAGCATPSGSAGHASATANLKLTFHLDHPAGADHWGRELTIENAIGNPGGSLEATRRSFNKDLVLALAADFKRVGTL